MGARVGEGRRGWGIPIPLSHNSDIVKITSLHRDVSVDKYEGTIEGLMLGR